VNAIAHSDARIQAIRHFNRFYTRQMGILGKGLLDSPFSLSEVRVLYELANSDNVTAADLSARLGMDPGYLSRMISGFALRKLVARRLSESDGRQRHLMLTQQGKKVFGPLDRRASKEVAEMLGRLSPPDQRRMMEAMRAIESILAPDATGAPQPSITPYILRAHRPGDMGWITYRQAVLYQEEYGWNEEYEALVSEILAKFIRNFDPKWEHCWIAEKDGEVVGSVFAVKKDATVAQLRLLYVDPRVRGLGIGKRLVDECIRFSRQKKYRTLTLWTNSVLKSARRIYEASGFQLVKEEPHHSFGKDLVGQVWELSL
jgi:DNA-binding MarR family transcriptional regulator/predicted GNAT family acetyltransferase